jgi:hypothetical protein
VFVFWQHSTGLSGSIYVSTPLRRSARDITAGAIVGTMSTQQFRWGPISTSDLPLDVSGLNRSLTGQNGQPLHILAPALTHDHFAPALVLSGTTDGLGARASGKESSFL